MAEGLKDFLVQLTRIEITDILDIVLVAFIFYKLLPMVRSTGATRILRVVLFVVVLGWLTNLLNLHAMNFLIDQVISVGLIAIIILYQPELRRMIDQITKLNVKQIFSHQKQVSEMEPIIAQTVKACETMSQEKVGALIVFGRDNVLDEYTKTGTIVDAQLSEQLIRNIFFPKAALHDGAAVIQNGRVAAAGCVLPLSESNRLHPDLGTRHRAGVGMSEISDAVVIIISEETGIISVAVGGILKRHLSAQTLERILRNELCPKEEETKPVDNQVFVQLKQKMQAKKKEEKENGKEKE